MQNIEMWEYTKKVIFRYNIPIYIINKNNHILLYKDTKILVRYLRNTDTNFLTYIPIKDAYKRNISMNLGVKMKSISFLIKTLYIHDKYKLSSIPSAIIIDDLEFFRKVKIENIINN
jgi:hypothetical protein